MNIAVTGMGTATGEAIVRNLRRSLPGAWILGLDLDSCAPGLHLCDARSSLPAAGDPGFPQALEALAQEWRIRVLLPGLDLELPPLARAKHRLEELGCTVIVSEAEAVDLCQDKLRCGRELRGAGLPFVETLELEEWSREPSRIPFPLVAKPRRGSGSKGVRLLFDSGDVSTLGAAELVIQPYLVPAAWALPPGQVPERERALLADGSLDQEHEIGVQAVLGRQGEVAGMFATRNHLVRGFPIRHVPVDLGPDAPGVLRILEYLGRKGLRGPCNLQGRLTRDGFQAYEVNPRFSAGTAARAGMGFEEVVASIHLLHDQKPLAEVRPLLQGRQDRICLKVAQELFVERSLLEPDSWIPSRGHAPAQERNR